MAPAPSGLGLALGMTLVFLLAMCTSGLSQNAGALQIPIANSRDRSMQLVRLGEEVPEVFWHLRHRGVHVRNGQDSTIVFDRYRDKLIILDFWASWCSTCIHSVNKLDSLQTARIIDDFIVIPVTSDDVKQAHFVFKRYKWDMVSIMGDTLLRKFFPYQTVPHQVWIRDGKVIAMPKQEYATAENIRLATNGGVPEVYNNIQDLVLDPTRSLFEGTNGGISPLYKGEYSKVLPWLDGYQWVRPTYFVRNDTTFLYCNNVSIQLLYYEAFKEGIFPLLTSKNGSGIHWEIADTLESRFFLPPRANRRGDVSTDRKKLQWERANKYGYLLAYPRTITEEEARLIMRQDLNAFFGERFGLDAKIEDGPVYRYAILRVRKDIAAAVNQLQRGADNPHFLFGQQFHKTVIRHLQSIDGMRFDSWRVLVDSTGIDPALHCHVEFTPEAMGNLDRLNQELQSYGLYVTIEEKPVPVVIVRQRQRKNLA
ncbi:MAG: hypothetical protein EAS52_05745 [Parapedobacter sp.]|nr:MAG: hypothetical protein EAS52_05745 [Parapedobacter sp.]